MNFFILAFLNLFRNKKRTFLNLLILSISATSVMVVAGFCLSTYQSLEDFFIKESGDIVVAKGQYFDKYGSEELADAMLLTDEQLSPIKELSKTNDDVVRVFTKIEFSGIVANAEKSVAFIGNGVDPRELRLRTVFVSLQDGLLFTLQEEEDKRSIVLGYLLAEILGVKVGDEVTLIANTEEGILNAIDLKIVGTVKVASPELDKRVVYVHLDTAKEFLQTSKTSRISLYLEDSNSKNNAAVRSLVEGIISKGGNVDIEVKSWRYLAIFYERVKNIYNRIFIFFAIVLLALMLFVIHDATNSSVYERLKEIGTLRAIGFYRKEISRLFVIESFLMTVSALIVAAFFYLLISVILLFVEIPMGAPPGLNVEYPLNIAFSIDVVLWTTLLVVVCSVVGSYLSVQQYLRKSIYSLLDDRN